jgi:hypothetical protein
MHEHVAAAAEPCGNLGDDVLIEGGVSRRVSSLPEPPRKERYAMSKATTVIPLRQPEAVDDPLTEVPVKVPVE